MEKTEETIYRFNGSAFLKRTEPDCCFIERLDGGAPGKHDFFWEPVTVGDIWVTDGPKNYQIHAEVDGQEGTYELTYIIGPEEYRKFTNYKGDKRRLNLLLKKSRERLRKKKIAATKKIDIRVTREFFEEVSKNAETANMSVSKYCRELLEGKKPRAALSSEEQAMMMEVVKMRADMAHFLGAMNATMKGMTQEERTRYLIEGQAPLWWRKQLKQALVFLDGFINRQNE